MTLAFVLSLTRCAAPSDAELTRSGQACAERGAPAPVLEKKH
jgi:hypothetical protein